MPNGCSGSLPALWGRRDYARRKRSVRVHNRRVIIGAAIAALAYPLRTALAQPAPPPGPPPGSYPPPPPPHEARPPYPAGPYHWHWAQGRWRWNGYRWVWVSGHWRR